MFSFFRKSRRDEPAPKKPVAAKPAPQEVPAPAATPSVAASLAPSNGSDEIVEFESISAEAGSVVEEAAVYYANNMAEQALSSLLNYLRDNPEKKEMQPWLMLFDLYQLQNNKEAFNDLAMEFVVKFERSAPIWKALAASSPTKKADTAQKDLLTVGDKLAAGPQMEKLCLLAQSTSNARVDLSGIISVEAEGCRLMQNGLQSCRKKGKVIQLEGMDLLINLLKQHIAAGGNSEEMRPAWLLLFELYQWLGKEAEYEDLAIEYAVTFEISPPAWEAVKPGMDAARIKEHVPQPDTAESSGEDAFALSGVISESSQSRLQELANYASGKEEIRINMANVTRVDFVAVGTFLSTLINLTQAGKKVLILEANEMVQALLHMMGVQEFATLIRKRAR